jgi:hypothetical protein
MSLNPLTLGREKYLRALSLDAKVDYGWKTISPPGAEAAGILSQNLFMISLD